MFYTKASSKKKPITVPEQQDAGTYIGLLLGGIILTTGTAVLFSDLYSTFSTKGIDITFAIIFRMGLMLATAYGAISCFFALYRLAYLNRMFSKKIEEEFEDFVLYTRPFVEEVVRQRLAVEAVIAKLETLEKRSIESHPPRESQNLITSKWWEFLFFVALLTNISIGLYVYLEAHPFEMVPYSVIILGIAWWVLMAKYFGLLFDPRAIYIPAFFVAALPTLSILLRIILAPYQALFVVFLVLFFYVAAMYYYYRYLTTGISIFSIAKLREELAASKKAMAEKPIAAKIEAKKESVLEQMLSEIKKPKPIQRQSFIPVFQPETKPADVSVSNVIRSAFRAKIQSLRSGLTRIIWPQALCQNGRKISIMGLIMASLGVVAIIAFPDTYEDLYFEAILLGIVLATAGHSLNRKRGKKIFTATSLLFLSGLIMSLGAAISFHFLSLASLAVDIVKLTLLFTAGLILIMLDIFIDRIHKK